MRAEEIQKRMDEILVELKSLYGRGIVPTRELRKRRWELLDEHGKLESQLMVEKVREK